MTEKPQVAGEISAELAQRLHDVARCPFATSSELAALNGRALLSNVHRNIASLRERELVQSVDYHSGVSRRASARHFLTSGGLGVLSDWLGQTVFDTLRELPVSAEWQRVLLGRIETLALVYRIAVQVSRCRAESGGDGRTGVLFPRDAPLDGIISCADGPWFGVMRQGYALSLSNIGKRIANQGRRQFQPATIFIVTSDGLAKPPVMRRILERRATFTGVVAFEGDIPVDGVDKAVWTVPDHTGGEHVSLRDMVTNAGGPAAHQPSIRTSYVRAKRPETLADLSESRWATLTGSERRTLDDVFLWPLMDIRQLATMRGVPYANKANVLGRLRGLGLIERNKVLGLPRRRLILDDGGLRYLSLRDRTSLSALRKRWVPGSDENPAGTMLGKMELESSHTEGVNDIAARLQAEWGGDALMMSSLRGIRHFTDSAGDSQVSPDVIAALSLNGSEHTMFLEYEMRAVSPNPMRDKLLPWLRYFDTPYPHEDFQGDLRLLFVLSDQGVEEVFHEVATELITRTGVDVPLVTTHRELLDGSSTVLTAEIWRAAGSPPGERSTAFSARAPVRRSGERSRRVHLEQVSNEGEPHFVPEVPVQAEPPQGGELLLGEYLRRVRNERHMSLRDVQRLARQHNLGSGLSSGYLSVLEREGIMEPSPKVLQALAAIYEIDYIDLLRLAGYIPPDAGPGTNREVALAFRGVSQLSPEQRRRIQRMIDFELHDAGRTRGQGKPGGEGEAHGQ